MKAFEVVAAADLVAARPCEVCDDTDGPFVVFEGVGTFCMAHATECCGCNAEVSVEAGQLCDACRPSFEWAQAVDGSWGWYRRPQTAVERDEARDEVRLAKAEELLGFKWAVVGCVNFDHPRDCDGRGTDCEPVSELVEAS